MQSDNIQQESPYLSVEQKMITDLNENNIVADESMVADSGTNLEF